MADWFSVHSAVNGCLTLLYGEGEGSEEEKWRHPSLLVQVGSLAGTLSRDYFGLWEQPLPYL